MVTAVNFLKLRLPCLAMMALAMYVGASSAISRVEVTLPADEYDPATFESYIRAAAGGGKDIKVTVEGEEIIEEL